MNPNLVRGSRLTFAFMALALTPGGPERSAIAQDSAAPAAKKEDDRAVRLDEMKQIAGSFQAATIEGKTRARAAQVPEPLHRWTDPTRRNSDGALWAWRSSGRPIAIISIELYPQTKDFGTVWALEFTSLSTGPIVVEGGEHFDTFYVDLPPPRDDGRLRWAPARGGVAFREIPDAPAPAKTEAERLRQMRDLLKRFSAREFYNIKSQDYELRLLAHPIDRYADAPSGLMDGAIFIYANGTNPEALLLLEARRQGEGSPTWSYAAAPLTRAEPTLRLDRQEVWTHPFKDVPSTDDTYFLARRRRDPSARD
jgi:hypothetical protein